MTETKNFTWNPTVGSYVLSQLQIRAAAGTRTGVKRFRHQYLVTPTDTGWKCRVEATVEGFALIKTLVAEALADQSLGLVSAGSHNAGLA